MVTMMRNRDAEAELNLPPGFRFHPTDEELVVHYLCRKAANQFLPVPIIAEVDLYKFDPWLLPEMALFGNKEWYFFTPRDRKYPNGSRPNRAAGSGYWKATGADKPVTPQGCSRPVGIKKALVFYAGKAPKGSKTDWIMHEYRLADTDRRANGKKGNLRLDDWVLCRLYNKKNNWERDTVRVPKTEAMSSVGEESMDSFEEVASFAHKTPESDVDNEVYAAIDEHLQPQSSIELSAIRLNSVSDATTIGGEMQRRTKEDNDWFTELNLDDFQNPFNAFTAAPPNVDVSGDYQDYYCNNYYYSGVPSPMLPRIPSQPSLVQF